MKQNFVLAESGGTKTSWVVVRNGVIVHQSESRSLHPRTLHEEDRFNSDFLGEALQLEDLPLYFYGAGCHSELGQQKMLHFFTPFFSEVTVYSDLLAAAHATLGRDSGYVMILGTGSVMTYYTGNEIVELKGGWGPLIGDEGSAFYFGKLVVRNFLLGKLPELAFKFDEDRTVLAPINSTDGIRFLAQLAVELQHYELEDIHDENFDQFVQLYLNHVPKGQQIHCVGSYGYHKKEVLKKVLKRYDLELGVSIEKPIETLYKFHSGLHV